MQYNEIEYIDDIVSVELVHIYRGFTNGIFVNKTHVIHVIGGKRTSEINILFESRL